MTKKTPSTINQSFRLDMKHIWLKQASARGIIPSEYYHAYFIDGARGRARVGFIQLLFNFHSSLSCVSLAEMCPLSDGQILDWFPW